MLRPVNLKTTSDITSEWDALAQIRYRQISTGEDISYNQVITPSLLEFIEPMKPSRILDAGCGTGAFTSRLSSIAAHVVGVDPSGASIKIARSINDSSALFYMNTVEVFSADTNQQFDVVVANMVLMDALSLIDFLKSCRRLINSGGALVFSITHPCFWPDYYGYGKADWFQYEKEIIVESPFRITSDPTGSFISTHIHRPLSSYFEAFSEAGFKVQIIKEPKPPKSVNPAYLARWKFPRYLTGVCR